MQQAADYAAPAAGARQPSQQVQDFSKVGGWWVGSVIGAGAVVSRRVWDVAAGLLRCRVHP